LLRVFELWNRRRTIKIALIVGYAITYSLVLVFVIISAKVLHGEGTVRSEKIPYLLSAASL
jgi:hypothetical protein